MPQIPDDFKIGPDGSHKNLKNKENMRKIILEFDGEEELEEAKDALNSPEWKSIIWDLDQELRGVVKHGASMIDRSKEASKEEIEVCSLLRNMINERLIEQGLKLY